MRRKLDRPTFRPRFDRPPSRFRPCFDTDAKGEGGEGENSTRVPSAIVETACHVAIAMDILDKLISFRFRRVGDDN